MKNNRLNFLKIIYLHKLQRTRYRVTESDLYKHYTQGKLSSNSDPVVKLRHQKEDDWGSKKHPRENFGNESAHTTLYCFEGPQTVKLLGIKSPHQSRDSSFGGLEVRKTGSALLKTRNDNSLMRNDGNYFWRGGKTPTPFSIWGLNFKVGFENFTTWGWGWEERLKCWNTETVCSGRNRF